MKLFTVLNADGSEIGDLSQIALNEQWAQGLIYCDIDGFCVNEYGVLALVDDSGTMAFPPKGRFKIIWHIGEAG